MALIDKIPTPVVRELATEKGLPLGGSVDELRHRVRTAFTDEQLRNHPVASSYLETERTQNYRFYTIGGDINLEEVVGRIRGGGGDPDPFEERVLVPLGDTPDISHAEFDEDEQLYLEIAFRGETRTAQDGWDEVSYTPPIVAHVLVRPALNIVEIRGRREKLDVIEEWIRYFFQIQITHITFNDDDVARMRELLHARRVSLDRLPQTGGLGSIRLNAAGAGEDVAEAEATQLIDGILEPYGVVARIRTMECGQSVKVRANAKEGSFYVPRHINERNVDAILTALRITKGLCPEEDVVWDEHLVATARPRMRTIGPEKLIQKVSIIATLNQAQQDRLVSVLRSLTIDQQRRILAAYIRETVELDEETAVSVMNGLVRSKVLDSSSEYYCAICEAFGRPTDGWDGSCNTCGGTVEEQLVYSVHGYIETVRPADDWWHVDYRVLRTKVDRVLASRDPAANATNEEKKESLEDLSEYMFGAIEGWTCAGRNERIGAAEIDRRFENHHEVEPFIGGLGENVRVECKNEAGPVSAHQMEVFIGALRETGSRYGIYISTSSYSGFGQQGLADAKLKIRDAAREGIFVLPLTLQDIRSLAAGQSMQEVLYNCYQLAAVYGS